MTGQPTYPKPKERQVLQGEMSHAVLLTWERCCWTLKNSAEIVSELVKAEDELARLFRRDRGSVGIGYTGNPHPFVVSSSWTSLGTHRKVWQES